MIDKSLFFRLVKSKCICHICIFALAGVFMFKSNNPLFDLKRQVSQVAVGWASSHWNSSTYNQSEESGCPPAADNKLSLMINVHLHLHSLETFHCLTMQHIQEKEWNKYINTFHWNSTVGLKCCKVRQPINRLS